MLSTIPAYEIVDRKNVKLTEEEIQLIDRVLKKVWEKIRDRIIANTDGNISNKQAIDICLDNSRPSKFCEADGDQVETIIDFLLRNYSWPKTRDFLDSQIKLIPPINKN